MPVQEFDRSKLSARENEILDLAIEGLTDFQISLRLHISPSTVNSYWVRIRGKVGHLSRTELVAVALKQEAGVQIAKYAAQGIELERLTQRDQLATRDATHGEFYRTALDAVPEALFVADARGSFRYVNSRLEVLFGYPSGALDGSDLSVLIPHRFRERDRAKIAAYLQEPQPMSLGIDSVVYGLRKDGSEMRIILLLDAKQSTQGLVVTGIVRNFLDEVNTRRRSVGAYSRLL